METIAQFLPLFLMTYIISVGFGMVIGKARGVRAVNRFWLRGVSGLIRFVLRAIARFIDWVASFFG